MVYKVRVRVIGLRGASRLCQLWVTNRRSWTAAVALPMSTYECGAPRWATQAIIPPSGMPACVAPRGTPHSPKGSLVLLCTI